jgi:hypothetical protein
LFSFGVVVIVAVLVLPGHIHNAAECRMCRDWRNPEKEKFQTPQKYPQPPKNAGG